MQQQPRQTNAEMGVEPQLDVATAGRTASLPGAGARGGGRVGGKQQAAAATGSMELDTALARIAFRALGSREADKLRLLTDGMPPEQLQAAVRAAADVFASAVHCAIDSSAGLPAAVAPDRRSRGGKGESQLELAASLRGERLQESAAKAAKIAVPPPEKARRRLGFGRRGRTDLKDADAPRSVADVAADMETALAELRGLSAAFVDMTSSHRNAVLDVCHDALRSASPALTAIEQQFAGGLVEAAKSTTAASRRVAALAAEQDELLGAPMGSSTPLSAVTGEISSMIDRVNAIATEANWQARHSVEIMTGKMARGGFSAVIATSSRLDTRSLLPRRKSEEATRVPKGVRAASMLNTVDSRSAEVSTIVTQFNDDLQNAAERVSAISSQRVPAEADPDGKESLSRKAARKKKKDARRSSTRLL
jgi:hypothetical protein